MSDPLLTVAIPRRIVPYTRQPDAAKWSDRSRRYRASLQALAVEAVAEWRKQRRTVLSPFDRPVRVGVAVWLPPVASKRSPHFGDLPGNAGDWDNFYKAALDGLVYACVLRDDSAWHVRGPHHVAPPAEWLEGGAPFVPSGVYLSTDATPREATVITVWGLA